MTDLREQLATELGDTYRIESRVRPRRFSLVMSWGGKLAVSMAGRDLSAMRLSHLCGAALSVLAAANVSAQTKALRFASVVDGSGRVIANGVVIVDGDKITRVAGPRDPLPANALVIDLTKYTAIPGMIDAHTHVTYGWDAASGTDPWRQPRQTPEQARQLQRANALHTLETGVTAVRDLGASNYSDIALRDSINKGGWIGPRMFVAGSGLSRARRPYRSDADTTRTTGGRIYDISQIPEAVKQQVDAGADYIKMYGSTAAAPTLPETRRSASTR